MKSFSLKKSCTLFFCNEISSDSISMTWHANSVCAILMIGGILKWNWHIFIFSIRINSSFIWFKPLFFHAVFAKPLFLHRNLTFFTDKNAPLFHAAKWPCTVYLLTFLSNFSLSEKYMRHFWVNSWSPLDSLRCLSLSSQSRNFIAMELEWMKMDLDTALQGVKMVSSCTLSPTWFSLSRILPLLAANLSDANRRQTWSPWLFSPYPCQYGYDIFKIFLHVSKFQYFFPIWILIVLIYEVWETFRNKLTEHSDFHCFNKLF